MSHLATPHTYYRLSHTNPLLQSEEALLHDLHLEATPPPQQKAESAAKSEKQYRQRHRHPTQPTFPSTDTHPPFPSTHRGHSGTQHTQLSPSCCCCYSYCCSCSANNCRCCCSPSPPSVQAVHAANDSRQHRHTTAALTQSTAATAASLPQAP